MGPGRSGLSVRAPLVCHKTVLTAHTGDDSGFCVPKNRSQTATTVLTIWKDE